MQVESEQRGHSNGRFVDIRIKNIVEDVHVDVDHNVHQWVVTKRV
jgi:hypothetical protein